jgi:hypothetical protein
VVDRVVLHIGTMKSGTSYLQRVLESGVLENVGGFYAGGAFRAQSRAVDGLPLLTKRGGGRAWRDLAARVVERDGTAVYSHEFLSFASKERVQQVVEPFAGVPVEVLLTVRDQHSALPAQWQSFVRNKGIESWEAYLAEVQGQRRVPRPRTKGPSSPRPLQNFRRTQDVPGMVRRWGRNPGVSGVSVVAVPPPGSPPELLWQRFTEAADLAAVAPPGADVRVNESLGYASCDLLRRLNESLIGLNRLAYERARRAPVQALLPLRELEARPVLDRAGGATARRLNGKILRAASRDGVRLVGSAEDLPVDDPGTEPEAVPPADPDEVRRALDVAWTACLPGAAPPPDDVDAAVTELGRRLVVRFG